MAGLYGSDVLIKGAMSKSLIDFLRTEGVDEDVGDDLSEVSSEAGEEGEGEKIRMTIFNDNYTEVEPLAGAEYEGSWVFPSLYKPAANGQTLTWQIGYNDISKKVLWTVGRVETGGMTLYNLDVIPTRAQKYSFQKKALVEALAKYALKTNAGFYTASAGVSALPTPLPMLAQPYKPPDESKEGNAPDLPLAAQAKFDGERHLIYIDTNGDVKQMTRLMHERAYFNHISEEAAQLLEFLPAGTILDGELYSPLVGFQMITSIAGTKKKRHEREGELDYYLFDIYHPETVWRPGISKQLKVAEAGVGDREEGMVYARASGYTVENYTTEATEYFELPHDDEGSTSLSCVPYTELLEGSPLWVVEVRVMLIMNAFRCYRKKYKRYPRHLKLVKTYIIHQREDIPKLFGEMIRLNTGGKDKLEGIMLRHLSRGDMDPSLSLYRPGRSNNLLKVKKFMTTEVVVTGVKAGRGKHKDLAVLSYKEPGTGKVGTVVAPGTFPVRRAMLLNPASVKGKTLTVSFQNRLLSGALRFPTAVGFRD